IVGVAIIVYMLGRAGRARVEAHLRLVAADDEVAAVADLAELGGIAAVFAGPLSGQKIIPHRHGTRKARAVVHFGIGRDEVGGENFRPAQAGGIFDAAAVGIGLPGGLVGHRAFVGIGVDVQCVAELARLRRAFERLSLM